MDSIGNFVGGIIASPFYCIGWIIIGFLAGALARRIMGSGNAGCASDIILGLIGAFVGGIVVSWLGFDETLSVGFGIGSLITAVIGAIILIAIGRVLSPKRK